MVTLTLKNRSEFIFGSKVTFIKPFFRDGLSICGKSILILVVVLSKENLKSGVFIFISEGKILERYFLDSDANLKELRTK